MEWKTRVACANAMLVMLLFGTIGIGSWLYTISEKIGIGLACWLSTLIIAAITTRILAWRYDRRELDEKN